jgi:hypothetical protein
MANIKKWLGLDEESKIRGEAMYKIRIEDYGDDVCITIDGIKARSVTDVAEAVKELKELREDYVRRHLH